MIGHYLLTLDTEAEDAILTGILKPGGYGTETERCLVGWAAGMYEDDEGNVVVGKPFYERRTQYNRPDLQIWGEAVEARFDNLCYRFGVERIGQAIRNRILANRARRELAPVSSASSV